MSEKDDGGPAFGHAAYSVQDDFTGHPGMSLRDWYAGMALQGLLSNNEEVPPFQTRGEVTDYFARSAYEFADAMLKARKK